MKLIVSFCFLVFGLAVFGQNDTAYYSYFGGDKSDQLISVIDNQNGTFSLLGYTSSIGNGSTDIIVFDIDTNLNLVNQFSVGTPYIEKASGFVKVSNNYFISGLTNGWGNGQYEGYLLKTDTIGTILFEKTFGGESWDELLNIVYFNGFISILSYETIKDTSKYLLYAIDTLGNNISKQVLPSDDIIYSSLFSNGDTIFLAGSKIVNGKQDAYLVSFQIINNNFKEVFSKTYDFDQNQKIVKGKVIGNEIFLMGESNFISTNDNYDVYLASYSVTDGAFNWSSHYGSSTIGNDYSTDIYKYNNQLYLCGTTNSYGQGQNDFYPLILSETGSFIDGTTFGNERDEWANSIIKTPSWLFIFGTSEDDGISYEDILVLKTKRFIPFPPRKYSKTDFLSQNVVNHIAENKIIKTPQFDEVKVYNLLGQEIYRGSDFSKLYTEKEQLLIVNFFFKNQFIESKKILQTRN